MLYIQNLHSSHAFRYPPNCFNLLVTPGLNFRIVHLKERTFKFCIFTNCFKMAAVSSIMGPINIFVIQLNFWNSCNFEIKFNSIKLILLCYNTYLYKFCLLYLFKYLFKIHRIGWSTGIVPVWNPLAIHHQLKEISKRVTLNMHDCQEK